MNIYTKVERGRYIDSLETLLAASILNEQPGLEIGYAGMATEPFKDILADICLLTEEIKGCDGSCYVVAARAESQAAFDAAVAAVEANLAPKQEENGEGEDLPKAYPSIKAAVEACPRANLCSVAVPGEYALAEVKKALNAGLHCVVFSNNVPLSQEREMKELAREKGLLCMGPDCGVANINGAALVLASVNNRGPFGICGASGVGIQHVAAILHEAGSGVSQTIGTGGNDLKNEVGGIMMLMGIDALEADPETSYIALIARRIGDQVEPAILDRVSRCKKPVVAMFMSSDRAAVERTGAIWAADLDDCAQKCLRLIGKDYPLETEAQIRERAAQVVPCLAREQKYVRGAFSGGTFMDEAMHTLVEGIGPVYSNCPLKEQWRLPDSHRSVCNACVDYGEEEFTRGRPHPAIDPGVRRPAILREAADPETAVILLDFILTPPGHMDPVGFVLDDIRKAQAQTAAAGRQIVFVASVLGTDADFQNVNDQRKKLEDAGVLVCKTNRRAAMLAGEIIRQKQERDQHEL